MALALAHLQMAPHQATAALAFFWVAYARVRACFSLFARIDVDGAGSGAFADGDATSGPSLP
jgi:hypothetical protein